MKTTFQHRMARQAQADEYTAVAKYCALVDMWLSRDPVEGYWLHYDGRMRFVRFLSEVRGWVDYLNP